MTGIGVVLMTPPDRLAASAAVFEDAGVDSLWLGEYFQSAIARAAVVASTTRRVRVGTSVLQAFARSPLTTALAADDLQEMAGGRFVLGLGSQLRSVNRAWHGVATPQPLTMLGEVVAAIRAIWAAPETERVRFDGRHIHLDVPGFRPPRSQPHPPIYAGGAGSGTIGAASDFADGMLGHLFWSLDVAGQAVERFARSPRGARPVTVSRIAAPVAVEGSRADAARRLAHYVTTPAYAPVLERSGLAVDRDQVLDAIRHGDERRIASLVEPLHETCTITTSDELRSSLAEAENRGIAELILFLPYDAASTGHIDAYEIALADIVTTGCG